MKKVIKAVLSFLLFAAFVAALYFGLKRANILFMHKDSGMLQYNFGNLERDTLETVFVGNSHQFCSIDTEILANEYGINSFMLASSAQTIAMSYVCGHGGDRTAAPRQDSAGSLLHAERAEGRQ